VKPFREKAPQFKVFSVIDPEPLTLIVLVDGFVDPEAKYVVLLFVKLPPLTVNELVFPPIHRLPLPIDTVPPDCVKAPLPPESALISMPDADRSPLLTAIVPD
jgi:hypothetical protein